MRERLILLGISCGSVLTLGLAFILLNGSDPEPLGDSESSDVLVESDDNAPGDGFQTITETSGASRSPLLSTVNVHGDESLEGVLRDWKGKGIPRGEVLLYTRDIPPALARRETTDEQGRFRLRNLEEGSYWIDAHDGEYSLEHAQEIEITKESLLSLDLRLAEGHLAYGNVVDHDSRPLEKVEVSFDDMTGEEMPHRPPPPIGSRVVETDAKGAYILRGLRAHRAYVAHADKEGYYQEGDPVVLAAQSDITHDLVLVREGLLEGIVLDPSGKSRPDVRLSMGGKSVVSDKDGRFAFEALRGWDGARPLWAFTEDLSLITKVDVYLPRGKRHRDFRVSLGHSARISGRVLSTSGAPIAGAVVSANRITKPSQDSSEALWGASLAQMFSSGSQVSTSGVLIPSGNPPTIELPSIEVDVFEQDARTINTYKRFAQVETETNAFQRIEPIQFVLSESLSNQVQLQDLSLNLSGLRLNVRPETLFEAPLENRLKSRRRQTQTDEDGRFEILGLFPGTYQVSAKSPRFLPADSQRKVELPNLGSEANVDLFLAEGARLVGIVLGPDRQPCEGATVFAHLDDELVNTGSSNEDGSFEVSSLPTGLYDVYVRHSDHRYVALRPEFSIEVGNTYSDLVFTIGPGGQVRGQVMDTSGQPLRSARVVVRSGEQQTRVTRESESDEEGRFEIHELYPGEYTLVAEAEGYLGASPIPLVVQGSEPIHRDVVLSRGTMIEGTVFDAGMRPADDVHVFLVDEDDSVHQQPNNAGQFRYQNVRPGRYWLYCRSDNYLESARVPFEVRPGQVTHVQNLTLGPSTTVSGRVVDASGKGLAGIPIHCMTLPERKGKRETKTLEDGTFELRHVYSGLNEIRCQDQTKTLHIQRAHHKGVVFEIDG